MRHRLVKRVFLVAVVSMLFSANVAGAASFWFNTSWKYRILLTIDSGDIDEGLTDFPILVYLNASRADMSLIDSDLDDVRFVSKDGLTIYDYEIEDYNATDAWLWVCIPSISNITDTEVYMYFGNAMASSAEDKEAVWDSSFVMVQHMVDETNSTVLDSTQYDNDGSKFAANEPIEVDGQIDGAQDFDGDDDHVTVGDSAELRLEGSHTGYAWLNIDNLDEFNAHIVRKHGIGHGYIFKVRNTGALMVQILNGGVVGVITSSVCIVPGTWYHVAYTMDAAKDIKIYCDGIEVGSGTSTAFPGDSTGRTLYVGASETVGEEFDGTLEEVRISNSSRSVEYISASYESGRDDLISFGDLEEMSRDQYWGGSLIVLAFVAVALLIGIGVTRGR